MESRVPALKSDFELIEEFQNGREFAFTELVARHKEKAVQIAYSVLGNYEDAKDASQEAFVKVYRGLAGFEKKSKFSTWLYRILINSARDHARARRWKQLFVRPAVAEDGSEGPDYLDRHPDVSMSPRRRVLNEELKNEMDRAMAALPERQRLIFSLRYQQDLPLSEIAIITGSAEGTVKASLHFAAKKFKESMKNYFKEGEYGHE
ncbi:MAG: hypothetical protein COW13_00515 [Candidatus Omnitrophica bacterium CG12_big_fil_rev_8_21_14_0_65_50_5]|nr:MAG: hypothetical protein COW13_00515 [Candidatus Omnitrophica bacterium CG12_big_fil_rev_8_21_14_0_65_50_5]